MISTKKNEKLFWDNKAEGYPLPFDPPTLKKTFRLVRAAEKLGADFSGRTLLDIGCGTGIYALALAAKVNSALGVDSSGGMLRRFRAEAGKHHIRNAKTLKSAWGDVEQARVAKKFDIALASMTHAVITLKDLRKMETAARELCVYIGWAGIRRNSFLEKIYAHHKTAYLPPAGAERIIPLLKRLGRRFKLVYLKDSWQWRGKPEDSLKDIELNLKVNNTAIDRAWLDKFLKNRIRNGILVHTTIARKAIIVWKPGV